VVGAESQRGESVRSSVDGTRVAAVTEDRSDSVSLDTNSLELSSTAARPDSPTQRLHTTADDNKQTLILSLTNDDDELDDG